MRMGFAIPTSGPWATVHNQVDLARRAEQLGYHSLWTFSRLLYPLDTDDPHWTPPFSPAFRQVHEPIVTLAHIAAHTDRIRLGVSVLNLPFYPPVVLGRQLIELDVVSHGRIDLGFGVGWSVDEYRAVGVPMRRRVGRMLENLSVLRAMWEHEEAEFQGEFATLPRSLVLPRPVQPRLPVLLGGSGDKAWRRVGRLADGWVSPGFVTPNEVREAVAAVRAAAVEASRDPAAMQFVVRATVRLCPAGAADRIWFTGSPDEIRSDIDEAAEIGATTLFLDPNFDDTIVAPDADPDVSMKRVQSVLEMFAPAIVG